MYATVNAILRSSQVHHGWYYAVRCYALCEVFLYVARRYTALKDDTLCCKMLYSLCSKTFRYILQHYATLKDVMLHLKTLCVVEIHYAMLWDVFIRCDKIKMQSSIGALNREPGHAKNGTNDYFMHFFTSSRSRTIFSQNCTAAGNCLAGRDESPTGKISPIP